MKQEFQLCLHQWQNLWAWYGCQVEFFGSYMMQDLVA